MGKIHILERHVAELIAAGEVVERPSSVVKELLENAIDAKASAVTLEIRSGGNTYIRITDNGIGIEREDVRNAFVSHATSKVQKEADLVAIGTLGFRGEALASIATVAKVELLTRPRDEELGTRYEISGGEEISFDEAGCPVGTTIVVRDLFFNTPARMKFLKTDVAEANSVAGVVDRIALSHPEVSFRFIREGKETLLTPGDGKLFSAIHAVLGREFANSLIPVSYEMNRIRVHGMIAKPAAARPTRGMQYFFVNNRLVKTRTAMAALEEAYKNSIMTGKFPSCVLYIDLAHETVDVNVHPAKIEVRFENEKQIFDAVYYACKSALQQGDSVKHVHLKAPVSFADNNEKPEQLPLSGRVHPGLRLYRGVESAGKPIASVPPALKNDSTKRFDPFLPIEPASVKANTRNRIVADDSETSYQKRNKPDVEDICSLPEEKELPQPEIPIPEPPKPEPEGKVLGEAFGTYIIVESNGELLIVDKHAAHERMIYEELKSRPEGNFSQLLLNSVTVSLSKEEYSVLLQNGELLNKAGFSVDDFGAGTVIVREAPMAMENQDVISAVTEIAGNLLSHKHTVEVEKLDWIYHSVACRAAVKAGDVTPKYELERFIKKLLAHPEIRYCPHGRPVMIRMTKREIEKQFGRV